jgi:hypothetical protein
MRLYNICEALSKSLLEKTATALDLKPSELRSAIAKADVDESRLPHGDWICKQYAEKFAAVKLNELDESERLRTLAHFGGKIQDLLSRFVSEKQSFERLGLSRNINDYTPDSLKTAIHDAVSSKDREGDGVKKVGSTGAFTVYMVSDVDALAQIGEGTSWCTRASYPAGSRAAHYIEQHGWLYVVLKGNKPFMQICSNLTEPMNVRNQSAPIPPEIFKIILPSSKPSQMSFDTYLLKFSSLRDASIIFSLIDIALRPDSGITRPGYSLDMNELKQIGKYLAQLTSEVGSAERNKLVEFCLKSQPALMLEYASSLPDHLNQNEAISEQIRAFVANSINAKLDQINSQEPAEAIESFTNELNWFLAYIPENKITSWPALDSALALALGGTSPNSRHGYYLFMIADMFLDSIKGTNTKQNPLQKFTDACMAIIDNPTANLEMISSFLRRTAIFGTDQERLMRATLLRTPFAANLAGYFRDLEERWPEWEDAVFRAWPSYSEDEDAAGQLSSICLEYCYKVLKQARWPRFEEWLLENPWAEATNLSFRAGESGLAAAAYARVVGLRPWPEMAEALAQGIAFDAYWDPSSTAILGLLEVAYDGDQSSSEERVAKLFDADKLTRYLSNSTKFDPTDSNAPRLKHFNYFSLYEGFDDRLIFFIPSQAAKMLDSFDAGLESIIIRYSERIQRLNKPTDNAVDQEAQQILISKINNRYKEELSRSFVNYMTAIGANEEQAASVPDIGPRLKAYVERIVQVFPELSTLRAQAAAVLND